MAIIHEHFETLPVVTERYFANAFADPHHPSELVEQRPGSNVPSGVGGREILTAKAVSLTVESTTKPVKVDDQLIYSE